MEVYRKDRTGQDVMRFTGILRRLPSARPRISIAPKECLADECISIEVQELKAYQDVTIHATLKRNDVGTFESFANYTADSKGTIDLNLQPSLGGSFAGIEPMGLFWSMKASPKNDRNQKRLIIKDVSSPVEESIRIFDSHLNYEQLNDLGREVLAEGWTKRWFKRPGVSRIPVRWKRVRGMLFIPEGNGPFPAVIDMFGTVGGLMEYRASLLASRGYLCLALGYFAYEDLPKTMTEIDLGYFEEAKEFLESRPEANKQEIGIIGTSYGGAIALACTTYLPGIKCAVLLNPFVFVFYKPFIYKGRLWATSPPDEMTTYISEHAYMSDGALVTKHLLDDYYDGKHLGSSIIEFAKCDRSFLFLCCEDDMANNMPKTIDFLRSFVKEGKGHYKIVAYPEAGHLLEPPYIPHVDSTYVGIFKTFQKWGGKPKMHARAQERSWQEILHFLKLNLIGNDSKL